MNGRFGVSHTFYENKNNVFVNLHIWNFGELYRTKSNSLHVCLHSLHVYFDYRFGRGKLDEIGTIQYSSHLIATHIYVSASVYLVYY